MTRPRKLVLAGGSGFLGRTLAHHYADASDTEVVVLARRPETVTHARAVGWDGRTLGRWTDELEGATAVINLAGRSVNCRYHEKNRNLILGSRLDSTRILGEAIRGCDTPPSAWLNSSTATIYRHTLGPAHDETGEIGATPEAKDAFSVQVAREWEAALDAAEVPPGVRKLALRTALVIGPEPGGVYEVLRRLARFGLGGTMGSGRQFVSWIHAADFCRAFDHLLAEESSEGVYNLCAPNPVPNAEMMRILRRAVGTPFGLPAPAPLLEVGAFFLRTETELILKSRRVVPGRLLEEGFSFQLPTLESAATDLEQRLG